VNLYHKDGIRCNSNRTQGQFVDGENAAAGLCWHRRSLGNGPTCVARQPLLSVSDSCCQPGGGGCTAASAAWGLAVGGTASRPVEMAKETRVSTGNCRYLRAAIAFAHSHAVELPSPDSYYRWAVYSRKPIPPQLRDCCYTRFPSDLQIRRNGPPNTKVAGRIGRTPAAVAMKRRELGIIAAQYRRKSK